RRPIAELLARPDLDPTLRERLELVRAVRAFAAGPLGLRVGNNYATFAELDGDTTAYVLSAAYRDRLAPYTWWYPVVGRVPYQGFFERSAAEAAGRRLAPRARDPLRARGDAAPPGLRRRAAGRAARASPELAGRRRGRDARAAGARTARGARAAEQRPPPRGAGLRHRPRRLRSAGRARRGPRPGPPRARSCGAGRGRARSGARGRSPARGNGARLRSPMAVLEGTPGEVQRFAVDWMLGRLARWLRILGHDVAYGRHLRDRTLVDC